MVARIYKLNKEGERYRSYTTLIRVTKLEETDNILRVHTYFSDNCGEPVREFDLDTVGVDIFVGSN